MTWPLTPLRDLTCLADSGTWGEEAPAGAGSPVLRSSNIQGGLLDLSQVAWRLIPKADTARRQLQSGDLLVTKSSGSPDLIGKCCEFTQPEGDTKFYFSNFTLRLRADNNRADSKWLFLWLSSARGRAVLDAMNTTTSGLRNLNIDRYLAQLVPAPPVTEQRRIAGILDKADAVRRKRRQALQLTDDLLRSTFLEMFGDLVTNTKAWRTVNLRALLSTDPQNGIYRHATKYGRGYPIVRINSFYSGELTNINGLKRVDLKDDEAAAYLLCEGDILVNRVNSLDFLGKSAIVRLLPAATVFESNMMRLRLDPSLVNPDFLVSQLHEPHIKRQILRRARNAVNQSSINQDDVGSLQVRLPPIALQAQFATLKSIGRVAAGRQAVSRRDADRLSSSLVQLAFRGEL